MPSAWQGFSLYQSLWQNSFATYYISLQYFSSFLSDRTARLWNVESGQCLLSYMAHNGSVNSIRFHPTEQMVCTGKYREYKTKILQ